MEAQCGKIKEELKGDSVTGRGDTYEFYLHKLCQVLIVNISSNVSLVKILTSYFVNIKKNWFSSLYGKTKDQEQPIHKKLKKNKVCRLIPPSFKIYYSPDRCGSVGWASSCKAKDLLLDPQSGHLPGLWVQSPVRVHTRSNQSMFLSHIDVSLPPLLPPSLSKNK